MNIISSVAIKLPPTIGLPSVLVADTGDRPFSCKLTAPVFVLLTLMLNSIPVAKPDGTGIVLQTIRLGVIDVSVPTYTMEVLAGPTPACTKLANVPAVTRLANMSLAFHAC